MMTACKAPLVLALLLFMGYTTAQSLRDPTQPPAELGQTGVAVDAPSSAPGSMAIIVRGGRPYLVVGTRLYAQGQKLGQARIERISETEVWLREGGALRKLPQFSGIERRTVTPGAAKPACAPGPSKKSPVAPCAQAQQ